MTFDDLRNIDGRRAEGKFSGFTGPTWGRFTPDKTLPPQLPRRLQVAFCDNTTYWLDVPEGSILPGDSVMLFECGKPKIAERIGFALPGEYFEKVGAIPHRLGTFVQLIRKAVHNG